MIRDLTKSVLSFSWAMSLFGTKQLADLSTPEHTTRAFDTVTQATEGQLSDVLKGAFRAGDHLERKVVDMALDCCTLQAFNPSQLMKMASDLMQQTTGTPRQGPQGSPPPSQDHTTGWGPIPPTDVK